MCTGRAHTHTLGASQLARLPIGCAGRQGRPQGLVVAAQRIGVCCWRGPRGPRAPRPARHTAAGPPPRRPLREPNYLIKLARN